MLYLSRANRRLFVYPRWLLSILAASLLLGVTVAPAFAAGGQTGIITGTVIDAATRAPIAGAQINIAAPAGSYAAKTDARGAFSIVGVNVDTYTLSVTAAGYAPVVERGLTITGDQTVNAGSIAASKALQTIGRTRSRSAGSAFQPTQTVDSYTVSGARIAQTTGNPASTNLNDVVLAAPGVTLTDSGNPTIRGGSEREIGFQFDGVNFAEPFLSQNGSDGLFNGLGSVQVVEGVGDASQGGLGAGVINVIPKTGAYPAFGGGTVLVGGPNFNHQTQLEYGVANTSHTISNYISLNAQNYVPYFGYRNQDAASYGNYFNYTLRQNHQFLDNFRLSFGHDNNQSIQAEYVNILEQRYGDLGGVNGLAYYPYDPLAANFSGLSQAQYASIVALAPYTPGTAVAPSSPELAVNVNTRFLKFEYDNRLSASTYFAARYYNWERLENDSSLYSNGPLNGGVADYQSYGGPTTGVSADLTHQFAENLTVTLNGTYEVAHPIWNEYIPAYGFLDPLAGDFSPVGAGGCGAAGAPYVSCAFAGNEPRLPTYGIDENQSYFQHFGGGLRIQYNPTSKLRFDFGARYEGQNQHWNNPYNPGNVINPFDVPPELWTGNITNPKVWQPRFALNYLVDQNDSFRASYGRSAVFQNAQNAGTPLGIYPDPRLASLPPNLANVTPLLPGAPLANQCGTTLNGLAGLFPCRNYAQQFYWALDRGFDAPDAGGAGPSIYSNYDASYSHQFADGLSVKLTPFYKLGTGLPTAQLLKTLADGSQIFSEGSRGINRTTGVELSLTTAERPLGFSGFVSGTYQNVLQSAPPLSNGEFDGVPQLSAATIALGNVYRAGYISPLSVRAGGTYNLKNGFSVTPILQFDDGFPYNVGNLIASQLPSGKYANVPAVNFGAGLPIIIGFQNIGGAAISTNYYDPAYSGTTASPNLAASRGTPGSPSSGGKLGPANLTFNMTLQYKRGRNTVGVQFLNLFGNAYNMSTPAINPFFQPVANGLSGPQTGVNTCHGTYGTARGCANLPSNTYAFTNGAYILTNGNIGNYYIAPLQPTTVNVFYSLSL